MQPGVFALVCHVGLKLGTEYEMLVVSINDHGENEIKMNSVKAVTSGAYLSIVV